MTIVTIPLPRAPGLHMPRVGIGTWRIGEGERPRGDEIAALRHAHVLGFRHFDTAEMYGEGEAEAVLGEAIRGLDRDELFLVSKVYPWNAGRAEMIAACEASLARLGVEMLDLYLLHWPGRVPFEETLEGARALIEAGKIRAFGISNFDAEAIRSLAAEGLLDDVVCNQVMHNIPERGVETDLLPLLEAEGIVPVAYSPLEGGPMRLMDGLPALAADLGLSLPQLALSWHVTAGRSVPIPKSTDPAHLDDLRAAIDVTLPPEVMARIDALAPPRPGPLAIR